MPLRISPRRNDTETRSAAPPLHPGRLERRLVPVRELRMETVDGARYLTGHAAPFNSLSGDLGGWYERIKPGAFKRAIEENQEVHHLLNHNEDMILGNTASGTTILSEDAKGLHFRTRLGDRSYERDLVESINRGDLSKCSFGFIAVNQKWVDEKDPKTRKNRTVRELTDVDLVDVSVVGRPAYSETSAEVVHRMMFPRGIPTEVRSHMRNPPPPRADEDSGVCDCDCGSCMLSDCSNCSNEACDDENCFECPMQSKQTDTAPSPAAVPAPTPATAAVPLAPVPSNETAQALSEAAAAAARLATSLEKPANQPAADMDCMCKCESCVNNKACSKCSNTACNDAQCSACPHQAGSDNVLTVSEGQKNAIALVKSKLNASAAVVLHPKALVTSDGTVELLVYGDVGAGWFDEGITAAGMKDTLDRAGVYSRIRVRVNSFGGDAFEGLAIYNMIRSQGKPVDVFVDGIAASAAAIISMCGDTITVANNAMMMVHNASSMAYGYAADLRKTADILDKVSMAVAQTFVDRTKNSMEMVKGLMDAETWMNAAECLKDGFATAADSTEADEEKVLSAVRSSRLVVTYRNLPARFSQGAVEQADAKVRLQLRMRQIALAAEV